MPLLSFSRDTVRFESSSKPILIKCFILACPANCLNCTDYYTCEVCEVGYYKLADSFCGGKITYFRYFMRRYIFSQQYIA